MVSISRLLALSVLVAGSASGAIIQTTGIGLSINGISETALLGLPGTTSGRNAISISTPLTIPNLATISSLGLSSFDDPFVNYFGGVQNNTAAAETFIFTFTNPYTGGPYTILTDSFSDSFTDGNGNGNVMIGLATPATSITQPQVDGTNRDGQGVACNVSGTSGFSGTCNSISSVTVNIPATAVNGTFGTVVSFTLSPGDIYTFNGRVSLAAAPEPSTWILMSLAFGAMAFVVIRKRRTV